MKNTILRYLAIGLAAAALICFFSSIYFVGESQQVVITQFGKPVGQAVSTPGVKFKVPFIQKAHIFERRFLKWDGDPNQVPTRDKRFIWVDVYARWRISDPLLFFQRVYDERGAHSRLDDILDGQTRDAVANHDLVDIVRSTNRQPMVDEELSDLETERFPEIRVGREQITRGIIKAAAPRTAELGIELLDLQFKRIQYVEEVQRRIFERMISERKRIAEKFRSEGQGEASKILGDRERELKTVVSEAYRESQEIRGKADAEAAALYAAAHNQSAEARDFYRFLKTLSTYETTLSDKDMLILSTKGDYFRYLEKMSP